MKRLLQKPLLFPLAKDWLPLFGDNRLSVVVVAVGANSMRKLGLMALRANAERRTALDHIRSLSALGLS